MDNFNSMGTEEFHKKVTDPVQNMYELGQVKDHKYRFNGVDIKDTEEGVEINQNSYCYSLREIKIGDGRSNDVPLTTQELKEFRRAIGKLNCLQESTRPDLSYDTLSLSMKNRDATVGDLKKMNKVI